MVDAAYAPLFVCLELIGRIAALLERETRSRLGGRSERPLALGAVHGSVMCGFARRCEASIRRRRSSLADRLGAEGGTDPAPRSFY